MKNNKENKMNLIFKSFIGYIQNKSHNIFYTPYIYHIKSSGVLGNPILIKNVDEINEKIIFKNEDHSIIREINKNELTNTVFIHGSGTIDKFMIQPLKDKNNKDYYNIIEFIDMNYINNYEKNGKKYGIISIELKDNKLHLTVYPEIINENPPNNIKEYIGMTNQNIISKLITSMNNPTNDNINKKYEEITKQIQIYRARLNKLKKNSIEKKENIIIEKISDIQLLSYMVNNMVKYKIVDLRSNNISTTGGKKKKVSNKKKVIKKKVVSKKKVSVKKGKKRV